MVAPFPRLVVLSFVRKLPGNQLEANMMGVFALDSEYAMTSLLKPLTL